MGSLTTFLWPIDASTWIILPPDGDKIRRKIGDYSKMRAPPIGDDETPEVGSVELSRGWTIDELSEMVREGRNLALGARASMGLTFDNDPSMMCDLSGRLYNVPPVSLADRVKRRIARKLLEWRPLLSIRLHCCIIQKLLLTHHMKGESPVGRRPCYNEIDFL